MRARGDRDDGKRSKRRRTSDQVLPPAIDLRRDPNLIPAIVGDAIPVRLQYDKHVSPACDGPSFKACCLSCAVQLPSEDILVEHLQSGSRHVIARVCATHGAEEWR
jgi:hypothetical protein